MFQAEKGIRLVVSAMDESVFMSVMQPPDLQDSADEKFNWCPIAPMYLT